MVVFEIIIIAYSTSDFQMNYSSRFLFHIFAPVFLFSVYLSSLQGDRTLFVSEKESGPPRFQVRIRYLLNAYLLVFLFAFAIFSTSFTGAGHLAAYYPRAIDSHAEFGKILHRISKKPEVKSFSLGDAGMAAYHSGLIALDNIGLGSSAVARRGVEPELLDLYNLDVIAFHANPEGIRLGDYNQQVIFDWAISRGFTELCDIYWKKDYTLRIFAKFDIQEIRDLCDSSQKNNAISDREYLTKMIMLPPWVYWKE